MIIHGAFEFPEDHSVTAILRLSESGVDGKAGVLLVVRVPLSTHQDCFEISEFIVVAAASITGRFILVTSVFFIFGLIHISGANSRTTDRVNIFFFTGSSSFMMGSLFFAEVQTIISFHSPSGLIRIAACHAITGMSGKRNVSPFLRIVFFGTSKTKSCARIFQYEISRSVSLELLILSHFIRLFS